MAERELFGREPECSSRLTVGLKPRAAIHNQKRESRTDLATKNAKGARWEGVLSCVLTVEGIAYRRLTQQFFQSVDDLRRLSHDFFDEGLQFLAADWVELEFFLLDVV